MNDSPILFLPGPTEVAPELRETMSMSLVGHRSPEFLEMVRAVRAKLPGLLLTNGHVLFENVPATGLMDAAVRNLVRKRILHLVTGAFGERWLKASRACGREAEAIEVEWGRAVTPDMLREKLKARDPFEAVAITYSETSTGCLNPLRELAAVVREESPESLVLVDAVSALGGAELRPDDWGVDLVFAGLQKCLALPPGLTVFSVSERAMGKALGSEDKGYLLDFPATDAGLAQGKTRATPNVPLVYALSRQLDRIATEGLESRWRRHAAMKSAVEEWAREQGFEFLVDEPYRSPTVSALRASGRSVPELIARARDGGFVLGNGYGKLKNETFRIGHMGDHTVERVRELLDVLS